MEKVYLESSFISYLASRPSRDLVTAANQQITRDWWEFRRRHFLCCISTPVRLEVSLGDPLEAERRVELLGGLHEVAVIQEAEMLAAELLEHRLLPPKAKIDALHLSLTAAHGINYLLTWNCKHLANAEVLARIRTAVESAGFTMPLVCTPQELMGGKDDK